MTTTRTVISTDAAPAAIGPYSLAVRAGQLLFCAGQVGVDPKTGELVTGGVAAETQQALANMRAVLAAAGAGPENVCKTTIFLTDLGDFAVVNRVYGEVFASAPPARSTVEVRRLPKDARVEIEAIAVL